MGDTGGGAIGGVGTKTSYPMAVISIAAYQAGQKEPIWVDHFAQGKPTETGISNVLVSDNSMRDTLFKEATDSALEALSARYTEAIGG